ncbi:TPA: branched-chain-amino-acid transaminase [bacterium]|nr:branched-chain-amino-acid transaminase [bacterium]
MSLKVYIDGELVDEEDAKISVFDHGVLYGDGIFEGIRSYNGRVFRLEEHLNRLYQSAKAILLEIPLSKDEMQKAVISTLQANGLHDAYIRLVVTRGKGDLGLDPRKCPKPTVFIIASRINLYPEEFYQNGLALITATTRQNSLATLDPCIKSLNYLNHILAKIEANNAGFLEAVMLNENGFVAECTGENIFIVKRETLLTPPTWVGVLEGVTRGAVMELAKEIGLSAREEVLTRYDLFNANECFLTGTGAEVIPVIRVDGRTIGTGRPGEWTKKLIAAFRELTQREGVPIYG